MRTHRRSSPRSRRPSPTGWTSSTSRAASRRSSPAGTSSRSRSTRPRPPASYRSSPRGTTTTISARAPCRHRRTRHARDHRRRGRDQREPDHEHARRVLVGRADGDLTPPQAGCRRTGGRRAVVDSRRWLVGVLGDEHGLATCRRRGRAADASAILRGRSSSSSRLSCSRVWMPSQSRDRAAGPRFQGGGVVALARADRPLVFARPPRCRSACSRAAVRRGGHGDPRAMRAAERTWQVARVVRGAPAGVSFPLPATVTVPGAARRSSSRCRAARERETWTHTSSFDAAPRRGESQSGRG